MSMGLAVALIVWSFTSVLLGIGIGTVIRRMGRD